MLLCAHTKIRYKTKLNCRLLFHLLQRRQKNENHFEPPLMLCFSYLAGIGIDIPLVDILVQVQYGNMSCNMKSARILVS